MHAVVRELIVENKRTRSTSLDLGNCQLTEIPREISELVWLESLSFVSERLDWEGDGWRLRHTQNVLFTNQIAGGFDRLAPLTGLKRLYLGGARVGHLHPLGRQPR